MHPNGKKRVTFEKKHPVAPSQRLLPNASTENVIFSNINNKGIIILNRPKALNALNLSMVKRIYCQLEIWNSQPEVTMIIVKGTGGKAFCAGGDIKNLVEDRGSPFGLGQEFFGKQFNLNHLIDSLSIPYVSLIDGIIMGGGVGLAIHGHYRVATEKTVFAMPETKIGFFPDVGGTYFMPRLPGKLGIYLALTGNRFYGRDVYRIGVATHFVDSAKLNVLECELLDLEKPTLLSIGKVLSEYQVKIHKGNSSLRRHMIKINDIFDCTCIENLFHKLEREKSKWSRKQLEILKKLSPVSLKVTLKALHMGSQLTLKEALKMEFRIARRFLDGNDFYEGVRSVLIDRDHKPKWQPSRIEEVSEECVDKYFRELPTNEELLLN